MTKLATFAIPSCNGAEFIGDLLRSLLAQPRQDFELLLVDDASEDATVETARRVAGERIRIIENSSRVGIAANWNRCAEEVRTPFFCLAHQDDSYEPGYLERMLDTIVSVPRIGAVHAMAGTIDAGGEMGVGAPESYKRRFFDGDQDRSATFRKLFEGNYITCPSLFYRKECFEAIGPFDAAYEFAMDWMQSFRILLGGWELHGIPEILMHYRRHGASKSIREAETLNRFREEMQVLEWAREQGIQKNLLPRDIGPSPAVHNNLLLAAFESFEAGDSARGHRLLEFGRQEVPGFTSSFKARLVSLCTRLGRPGLGLLRLGLRLELASS